MRFHNHRKGITLLFVVSMIVMFMLLATTFLVISSQYLRGAKSFAKSEIFEREPVNDLDQCLYMLLRDSRDPNNPLRTHSLLADVYGYNSIIKANVQNGSAQYVHNSNNSLIQVVLENTTSLNGGVKAFSQNKNSHIGQLMTVTTGGMQGITCRIVGHVYNTGDGLHYFRVFPYLDDFYTDATNLMTALNGGPQVIINGRPFNGTGAGFVNGGTPYDVTDSFGGANLNQRRLTNAALQPNRIGEAEATMLTTYVGDGDVNEDHDVADYQNCFLAAEVPSVSGGSYNVTVLPSFHRQALVSNRGVSNRTLFRPNPANHPNFPALTGLNTPTSAFGLDAIDANGNRRFDWDVDNDNDLVKDSVWVDPNLPVMTDKSGRTYKRMYAILCRDMDGRFNLNAHSNRWHLDSEFTVDVETVNPPVVADEFANSTVSTVASADGGLSSYLPRGLGVGPPEVNMRTLLGNNDFLRVMYGDSVNNLWGRNGQDVGYPLPRPGEVQATNIDYNTLLRFYDVSQGIPIFGGSYGSYPDIQGRLTFGVDFNGLPVFSVTTAAVTEFHENEYERTLTSEAGYGFSKDQDIAGTVANYQKDAPFSYAEIERILRGNDNDASTLPNRVVDLAPTALNSIGTSAARAQTMFNRMNFGGHSFDMPILATDLVEELRQQLLAGGLTGTILEEELEEMLPPELFSGIRFDLNRIFGDGEDDNGDLVVDNHWGLWSEDLEATPANLAAISESDFDELTTLNRNLDLDNDGIVGNADTDEHLVRYQNAKHMYVIMRMILRTSGVDQTPAQIQKVIGNQDLDGNGNPNEVNDLAIFVAQWAINVVDFRDKDSIMTPFEFDLNPFNGWNVDGNPMYSDVLRDGNNTPIDLGSGPIPEQNPYVVFGVERPNILMTETFAFHDRRTEDTDDDTPGVPGNPNPPGKAKGLGNGSKKGMKGKNGTPADNDNDQRLRPLGAMFVELYNAVGVSSARTADIYSMPAEADGYDVATNNGIDLTRLSLTAGVSNAGGTVANKPAPVWRIVMTQGSLGDLDLDIRNTAGQYINRESGMGMNDRIERVIYFVAEDNGDMVADPGEYLKSELRYDLPARVLQRNGMFLLTRDVYDNMSPLTGISSAIIGTAAVPINGTNSYLTPLGRRTDVADENTDVRYTQTRSITMTPGSSVNSVIVRDLDAGGNPANYEKATLGIPIVGLNVSEPIGGYELGDRTEFAGKTVTDAGGTQYTETIYVDSDGNPYVFDGPLDRNSRPAAGGNNRYDNFPAGQNLSVQSYRRLHLQRLANPLAGWHPRSNPYLTVDSMPIDLAVFDGIDASDFPAFNSAAGFGTKERGEAQGINRNLWRVEPNRNQLTRTAAGDNHFHSYYLEDPTTADDEESLGHTKNGAADQINFSYDFTNNAIFGGNAKTFPSLAWNNRPFISQYELMLVPHTSSSQLLRKYVATPPVTNPYLDTANSLNNGYGHLLNFFQGSGNAANQTGPDFHRILDSVYVPSRFSQTETFLDSTVFGTATAPDLYLDADEAVNNADSGLDIDANDPGFRAPANFISNYREPGKVNANTIYTPEVWIGVNGGYSQRGGHESANFANLAQSRRNNNGTSVLGAINGPTFFPTPFRGAHTGNLVPQALATHRPADTGLLRRNVAGNNSLLDAPSSTVDANRHPSLKYLSRSRMGNLTTTRSNVYAVWITVGYFEFDENTNRLGEEIGATTGEIERHRAFYMIDRSIPVGFEPGKNHNVDKTIMLRRYIE